MTQTQQRSEAVVTQRKQAVAQAVSRIREIEHDQGVTRGSLEKIKGILVDLASKKELFSESDYPSPIKENNLMYLSSEDDDYRFALYLSTGVPGRSSPPHNHTTWDVEAYKTWADRLQLHRQASTIGKLSPEWAAYIRTLQRFARDHHVRAINFMREGDRQVQMAPQWPRVQGKTSPAVRSTGSTGTLGTCTDKVC